MYLPSHFRQDDPATLAAFIRQYSFAMLISRHDNEPFASHLPLLFDPDAGPHGALFGHMARANPQWQQADNQTVLAIFAGPHAYISPTWYQSQNVVPTWNYATVHAHGTFHTIDDEQEVLRIVTDTVNFYEAPMPAPWKTSPDADFTRKMLKAIVGFKIDITRLEGKWKLNQNHPDERRRKVIAALEHSPDQSAREIAALMQAGLTPDH